MKKLLLIIITVSFRHLVLKIAPTSITESTENNILKTKIPPVLDLRQEGYYFAFFLQIDVFYH